MLCVYVVKVRKCLPLNQKDESTETWPSLAQNSGHSWSRSIYECSVEAVYEDFKSLQRCYWIFNSPGMFRQRLKTFRRIVAIKQFKKSRSYLTARSLFVCHLYMPVWVCCGCDSAGGDILVPYPSACHTRFVNSVLSSLKVRHYPGPTVLRYASLLAGRLNAPWHTHVRIVFTAEARCVYCSTRRFPMWERQPAIDHVLTHATVSS